MVFSYYFSWDYHGLPLLEVHPGLTIQSDPVILEGAVVRPYPIEGQNQ